MTKNKHKILYLVTKGNWGGTQRYVYDLATSLSQDEFETLVIHGQGDILAKKLNKESVRTIFIKGMGRDIRLFNEIVIFFKLVGIIFREKPDVVHLNSSKVAGLGALAARVYQFLTLNFRLKIIFTVHGWAFNQENFNNFITKFASWLTVFFSTKTIVLSKYNYEQGVAFPLTKNKFVLIYNGVGDIDFKERENTRKFIADITGADIKKLWLVTISELHKNKGLGYLIEALAKLENKPVVFIIGEGEERDYLEDKIKNLNLEKNIYLMGFMENANTYLKAFDLFTLTSIKEGLPYVVLEAGLSGLPVVGSNISGINDILDKKTGLLFESKNSNELSVVIKSLISDRDKMAQLGHSLNKKIMNEFSIKKMLNQTVSLYY